MVVGKYVKGGLWFVKAQEVNLKKKTRMHVVVETWAGGKNTRFTQTQGGRFRGKKHTKMKIKKDTWTLKG